MRLTKLTNTDATQKAPEGMPGRHDSTQQHAGTQVSRLVQCLTSQVTLLSPQWSKVSSTAEGGSSLAALLLGAMLRLVTLLMPVVLLKRCLLRGCCLRRLLLLSPGSCTGLLTLCCCCRCRCCAATHGCSCAALLGRCSCQLCTG